MTIGEKIRQRRKELGMSQDELAIKIGYSGKSAISKFERGTCDFDRETIVKFCNALYVSPLFFFDDVDLKLSEEYCELMEEYEDLHDDYIELDLKLQKIQKILAE